MYGLVNRAIEELVISIGGQEAWQAVRNHAGVEAPAFLSMEQYPDELTYALVGAASQVLDIPVPDVLRAFGRHWMRFTGREGYGALIRSAGNDFKSFLQSLDALHTQISGFMPDLSPPSFRVEDTTEDNHILLHYASTREGLADMVTGLLEGVAEMFRVDMRVEHIVKKSEGAPNDVFDVRWSPATSATSQFGLASEPALGS